MSVEDLNAPADDPRSRTDTPAARRLRACFHPHTARRVPQCCTPEKHAFVSKIFLASGISSTQTAIPACIQPTLTDEPKTDLNHAEEEAKMVYGQVISEVLAKTGALQRCMHAPTRLHAGGLRFCCEPCMHACVLVCA